VQQDPQDAAEGLVQGIVGLIEGKTVESRLMEPKLIVRESCGAALAAQAPARDTA